MTTRKSFKRLVRARMAKTGERYAVARRALVDSASGGDRPEAGTETVTSTGWQMRGGLHDRPATTRWLEEMQQRAAWQRALKQGGPIKFSD